jgi:hypothetical protein
VSRLVFHFGALGGFVAWLLAASPATSRDLRDLHYGEALYHAHQERSFEALARLDVEVALHHGVDEPELDSLSAHIDDAEFGLGDFELRYRMHRRAGRAIRAVLEGNVAEPVRNDAAYRLARIHFQKGQPEQALRVLDQIEGEVPESIRDEVVFLRANTLLALGRPAEAVDPLRRLQNAETLTGFSAYNLGIALHRDGRAGEALERLDAAGRIAGDTPATQALRDKANLLLGTLLFESAEFEHAERVYDRVRLEGPFSNQALLRAGWSDASAERYERALVPWTLLAEREPTDPAVQEALLALPFAYSRLDVHGRAATLYGRAVETFASELAKLDASIRSVREGAFLAALVREEIRHDKDWVVHLRRVPEAPETFYLLSLMASHDFQTALQNTLDLEDLRRTLVAGRASLDALEGLMEQRRRYYEPVLPEVDAAFRTLDARMRLRLEQREHLARRLEGMLVAPRPEHLANAEEHALGNAIEGLATHVAELDDPLTQQRIDRLRGVLRYRLETEYPERLADAHTHLRELDAEVQKLERKYNAFVRLRQAAPHGYSGTEGTIGRLRTRTDEALARQNQLMARQGHVLELVASRELERRRERLVAYQHQARFAFADSYDRAAKAQARAQ